MTPTEKWIIGLALVYSVPAFFSGVGSTLLFVHWRDIRRALLQRLLSPLPQKLALEPRVFQAISLTPTDESQGLLPNGLRLR